jgi:hypothetical protein
LGHRTAIAPYFTENSAMHTMYFCYEGRDPIIRCWREIPRIGDTVALPELDDEGDSFRVMEVVWEGEDEPTLSIYLKRADGFIRRLVKSSRAPTPCTGGS